MIDLLRLYGQVVEEQSFTVVARKLGISQPAVSNQMRALEEKLGVKLLYRKGKGFALTPEGEIVYRHAVRLNGEWADLLQNLNSSEKTIHGRIHLGASHIPGEYLLPKYIASFRRLFPNVVFKLTIGDSQEIAEKVLAQIVDFAVVGAIFDTEKLTSEFWLKDELGFIVSSGDPMYAGKNLTLEKLKEVPMVIRESGSGHRRALEEAFLKRGLELGAFNLVLEAGSTEAVKNAVRAGVGYSFLSKHALPADNEDGLVWADVENFPIERGFYILTRRNKRLTTVAEEWYRFLVAGET